MHEIDQIIRSREGSGIKNHFGFKMIVFIGVRVYSSVFEC